MNNINYQQKFFRFLKERNCFDTYMLNFRKYWSKNHFTNHSKDNFFVMNDPRNFLLNAFGWANSNEKSAFWLKIHDEWLKQIF